MRVVSLNCSNTEIVCALGCAHFLVGVDDDSDFPPEVVEDLPRVGRDLEIDIEAVRELNPDLVLASLTVPGHERIVAALEEAGLPYLAPEPMSLEDIYRDLDTIGTALGVAGKAAHVVEDMRSVIGRVDHGGPTILIQWWPKPVIAPGRLSWVNGLLRAAGASNPLADREVKSMPLTDEEVAAINPDAIVISWCGVKEDKYRPDVIYRNEAFAGINAVQNGQVYCVPECYLGRPSPRVIEGYQALCQIVGQLHFAI